ncbi:MAG: hypothetical protein DI537_10310 [Stutzerimonas stutzeri]|nr:MAG: hypothetical protein DI537_10310 [Stutzerimonas stutzeri]
MRDERERVAAWLAEQRKDIPAHGWEFAAALRATSPAPVPGKAEQALELMWSFASMLVERHGMNGDDTLSDADHKEWQAAAALASEAMQDARRDWTLTRCRDRVEFAPVTSAARQWAIDAMPDDLSPSDGRYVTKRDRADEILQLLRAEQFVVVEREETSP